MTNTIYKYSSLFFLALLALVFIYFNYHEILFLRPQSVHQWRQCDNLSIALNYFQYDLSFINSKLHSINGNDGSAVGEFPIYYYVTAQLYKIVGEKEFILRLLHLATFSIGLFYIKKTIYLITKNTIFSFFSPFLFLSSTIIVYYSNNYISDIPALGLTFISWYFFTKHYLTGNSKALLFALLLITLASLIKTTSLITLVVYGILMLSNFKKYNFKTILMLGLPLITTLLWMTFAKYYNNSNDNIYFLLEIKPIWNCSTETINSVWNRLSSDWGWKNDISPPYLIYIVLASPIIILFTKINNQTKMIIGASISFCILFIMLFFPQLNHHDYYLVHIIPYFIVSFIVFIWLISQKINYKHASSMLIILFSIYGIIHSKGNLDKRYSKESAFSIYYNLNDQLQNLGLNYTSKILNLSDNTYCMSLYLMNLQGWTNLNVVDSLETQYIIDRKKTKSNTPKRISSEIENRINLGAEYIFVETSDDFIDVIPNNYLKNKIFENSDLMIFKIN